MSNPQAVERRVPGKFWYGVAAILFLGSMILPAPLVLWSVFSGGDVVTLIVAPQTKTVRFERGKYTVFSESRTVIDGEIVISLGSISGLRLGVRGAHGEEIPVEAVRVGTRYNYGGQTSLAVLEFSIPQEGDYSVTASYREQSANQRALLSIRKEVLGGLAGSILLAVGASLLGAFLGVWIFLRTLWKRRRLLLQGVVGNIRGVGQGIKRSARPTRYSPPGSADAKSPVQHQYDRDK